MEASIPPGAPPPEPGTPLARLAARRPAPQILARRSFYVQARATSSGQVDFTSAPEDAAALDDFTPESFRSGRRRSLR